MQGGKQSLKAGRKSEERGLAGTVSRESHMEGFRGGVRWTRKTGRAVKV